MERIPPLYGIPSCKQDGHLLPLCKCDDAHCGCAGREETDSRPAELLLRRVLWRPRHIPLTASAALFDLVATDKRARLCLLSARRRTNPMALRQSSQRQNTLKSSQMRSRRSCCPRLGLAKRAIAARCARSDAMASPADARHACRITQSAGRPIELLVVQLRGVTSRDWNTRTGT